MILDIGLRSETEVNDMHILFQESRYQLKRGQRSSHHHPRAPSEMFPQLPFLSASHSAVSESLHNEFNPHSKLGSFYPPDEREHLFLP